MHSLYDTPQNKHKHNLLKYITYDTHRVTPFSSYYKDSYSLIPEKTSSLTGVALVAAKHLGAAALSHIVQNQATKATVASKSAKEVYRHMFHTGRLGLNASPKQAITKGLISVLSPETNMVADTVQQFGQGLEAGLQKTKFKTYRNLTKEHKDFYKDLSAGNWETALQKTHDGEYRDLANAYLDATKKVVASPDYHKQVDSIKDAIKLSKSPTSHLFTKHVNTTPTIRRLQNVYNKSLGPKITIGLFDDLSNKELHSLAESSKNSRNIQRGVEGVVNGGLGYFVDPVTPILNTVKRVGSSYSLSKIPAISTVQNKITDAFLSKPINTRIAQARQGVFKNTSRLGAIFKRDIVNPLTYDMSETAGRLTHVVNTSPEMQIHKSLTSMKDAVKSKNPQRIEASLTYKPERVKQSLRALGFKHKNVAISPSVLPTNVIPKNPLNLR